MLLTMAQPSGRRSPLTEASMKLAAIFLAWACVFCVGVAQTDDAVQRARNAKSIVIGREVGIGSYWIQYYLPSTSLESPSFGTLAKPRGSLSFDVDVSSLSGVPNLPGKIHLQYVPHADG